MKISWTASSPSGFPCRSIRTHTTAPTPRPTCCCRPTSAEPSCPAAITAQTQRPSWTTPSASVRFVCVCVFMMYMHRICFPLLLGLHVLLANAALEWRPSKPYTFYSGLPFHHLGGFHCHQSDLLVFIHHKINAKVCVWYSWAHFHVSVKTSRMFLRKKKKKKGNSSLPMWQLRPDLRLGLCRLQALLHSIVWTALNNHSKVSYIELQCNP